MENIQGRNMKSRIAANVKSTKARVAYQQSKGRKAKKQNTIGSFLDFLEAMVRGFFGLFRRPVSVRCSRTYKYTGPARVRGAVGKRYDVAMREQGRKYKKQKREGERQSLNDKIRYVKKAYGADFTGYPNGI